AQADSIVAASLVRRAAGRPNQLQGGVSRYGFHRARIDFARRVLRTGQRRATAAAFEWRAIATAWAARGAWDSALVAADSAIDVAPEPGLFAYRLATVGAWLRAVHPQAAACR